MRFRTFAFFLRASLYCFLLGFLQSDCYAASLSALLDSDSPRCGSNYEDGTLIETSEYFNFSHVANQEDAKSARNEYWNRVSKLFSKVEANHCDEEFFFRAGSSGLNTVCPPRCPVIEKYSCEMIPKNPAKRTLEYIDVTCDVMHSSSPQSSGVARCTITIQFDIYYRCVHPSMYEGPTRLDQQSEVVTESPE